MDKEGAQPERVMQELSSHGVMVEDWGGDVPSVQVCIRKLTVITRSCPPVLLSQNLVIATVVLV